MHSQLIVIHRLSSANTSVNLAQDEQSLLWKTCLREILVTWSDAKSHQFSGAEVYYGEEAYRFLLEVICGLHSPIKAETEVQGQFKILREQSDYPKTPWGQFLRQTLENLCRDSKKVRTEHLKGLGGQSYGSITRKKFRAVQEVSIIGAGQLAQEIIPWLNKAKKEVFVFCRRPDRELDQLSVLTPLQNTMNGGLLIAAPISAHKVMEWLNGQDENFETIVDLRGESARDPLPLPNVINLEKIFSEMEEAKGRIESGVLKAQRYIVELAQCY